MSDLFFFGTVLIGLRQGVGSCSACVCFGLGGAGVGFGRVLRCRGFGGFCRG